MATSVTLNKEAIKDLVRVKAELDSIIESIELMSDAKFMKSYSKSKQQIQKREFVDWDAL